MIYGVIVVGQNAVVVDHISAVFVVLLVAVREAVFGRKQVVGIVEPVDEGTGQLNVLAMRGNDHAAGGEVVFNLRPDSVVVNRAGQRSDGLPTGIRVIIADTVDAQVVADHGGLALRDVGLDLVGVCLGVVVVCDQTFREQRVHGGQIVGVDVPVGIGQNHFRFLSVGVLQGRVETGISAGGKTRRGEDQV